MSDKDVIQTESDAPPKNLDDDLAMRKSGNLFTAIGASVGAILGLIAYIQHWF